MSNPSTNPVTIAIVGGDSLVGRALEVPLLNLGYDVRFLYDFPMTSEAAIFDAVDLVILPPRSGEEDRKAVLSRLRNGMPASSRKLPVIELVAGSEDTRDEEVWRVLWPCPTRRLGREIEAALQDSHKSPRP